MATLVFADTELARRLEGLTAREMWRFARAANETLPESGALAIDVAGGVAAFVGKGSPVNQAFGLGFADEVTDDDIALLERFFAWRGAVAKVGVCPLADPSLIRALGARGWVPGDFENVLLREVDPTEQFPDSDIEIRECAPDERDLWARAVAVGFASPALPTQPELELGRIVAAREDTVLLLAWVDGEPAGTGELLIDDGVGWLSADTTLLPFRGRGIQRALQIERLRRAAAAGCTLAVTESRPGSASQRNMERLGFRVAYTRMDMTAPPTVLSAHAMPQDDEKERPS